MKNGSSDPSIPISLKFLILGFETKQFFGRAPVNLPGQATYTSKAPETYKPQHMFVGASLIINSFNFILINADEYALRYMELNSFEVLFYRLHN